MLTMSNAIGWFAKLAEVYKNDRRLERLPAEFTGTLTGPFGTICVTGIDLTRNGAGVQSPHEFPLGRLVFLQISDLGLMGFAHVRHCSPRDGGYFLGLEFRDGLSRERRDAGSWDRQRKQLSGVRAWDEREF
jgi:hypothetical protein